MAEVYYRTPVGIALIIAEDGYLTKVSIRDEELEETTTNHPILLEAIKQLGEYFDGKRKIFELPIKQAGSNFQQSVWQQLSQIAYGTTITYLQQSRQMKNPLAIRAIAAANGK